MDLFTGQLIGIKIYSSMSVKVSFRVKFADTEEKYPRADSQVIDFIMPMDVAARYKIGEVYGIGLDVLIPNATT